jgi:Lrp/AsnC family transcriptional regulator
MIFERFSLQDWRLLELLQQDASRSTAQLAELIGVSQSVCWRRIQALKTQGVIKDQVALLDRKQVGLNTQVFVEVKLTSVGRANIAEFAEAVRSYREVMECFVLMGRVDFLLRVVTEDIEQYERFLYEKLTFLPGVQDLNSSVALSDIKSTTALPLPGRDRAATPNAKKRLGRAPKVPRSRRA